MDFGKTIEKATSGQLPRISASVDERTQVLRVRVKIPEYIQEEKEVDIRDCLVGTTSEKPVLLKLPGYRIRGYKRIKIQIGSRLRIKVHWDDALPPEFFSSEGEHAPSLIELNLQQARELRLSMNYLMDAIVTIDGKPPRLIYEKRIPRIPPELKARRAKEFVADVMPFLFWCGYMNENLKNKQKELRILIMAELEKQEEFSRLKKDTKKIILNNLARQFFWEYWNETRKDVDLEFQDFEAWFDQKIKNELNEIATMSVEKRFSEWRRTLDRMAQLPFE
jgi:hypothetical protein